MQREIRALHEQVKRAGLEMISCEHSGGGHLKAKVRNAQGQQQLVVAPCSASDWRAAHNLAAHLRRIARGQGMPALQPAT